MSHTPPVKRQTVHILTRTNTSLRSHGIRLTLPAQKQNSPSAKSTKKCVWDLECELAGPNDNTQVFTPRKDYATPVARHRAWQKESDSGGFFIPFPVDKNTIMNSPCFETKKNYLITRVVRTGIFFISGPLEVTEGGLIPVFWGLQWWENTWFKFS